MNQKQKDFILNKLIPFIQQENGEGFAMEIWLEPAGDELLPLTLSERKPDCGAICCIGGAVDFLEAKRRGMEIHRVKSLVGPIDGEREFHRDLPWSTRQILGLTKEQASVLFYKISSWPKEQQKLYLMAKSPVVEADAACSLLRLVVETEGRCLDDATEE